jgi:hypothetical protein
LWVLVSCNHHLKVLTFTSSRDYDFYIQELLPIKGSFYGG